MGIKLRNLKKRILVSLSACIFSMSTAFAMPELMPMNEIQPGMSGVAYTVVDGSKELKSMDVSIIGTIGKDQSKGNTRRIIAQLSGPVVEEAGGLLSGMSGSPVYIDGKLVGALSATFKEMSPYRAIITPIEDMVKIWDMPDRLNKTHWTQVDVKRAMAKRELDKKHFEKQYNIAEQKLAKLAGREISDEEAESLMATSKSEEDQANTDETAVDENVTEGNSSENAETISQEETENDVESAAENTTKAEQLADDTEPKMVFHTGGFSGRGFDFLKESLHKEGIAVKNASGVNISGTQKVINDAELEPGSPVGVAAVVGDFSVGAVGTVTAVDGNKILAFGHPFVHRGNVNFFMTDADVVGTVAGPTNGMKVAESSSLIGRVNQDRENGISGVLGTFPQSVPVIVNVKDKDLGTEIKYASAVAYNEDLLPALTTSVAYAAMSKSIDRLSGSTADFKFSIRTDAADNNLFERRNMFYSDSDVGKAAVTEMGDVMKLICANKEKESNIMDINVDVSVKSDQSIASIISATPAKTEVAAGEEVNIKVVLKPYRQEKKTINVPFIVPKIMEPGEMNLDIHGGALSSVAKLLALQQQAAAEAQAQVENGEDKVISTNEQLRKIDEIHSSNEIIVEPSVVIINSEKEQKKAIKEAIKLSKKIEKMRKEGKLTDADFQFEPIGRVSTNYIIDNGVHAKIQIVKPEKLAKENKSAETKKQDSKKKEKKDKKDKKDSKKSADDKKASESEKK